MSLTNSFARQYQVAMQGAEAQTRAAHVAAARATLKAETGLTERDPEVQTFVDRQQGAALESVKVPGVILFRISRLADVADFALPAARGLSPRRSGRYKTAWLALVDNQIWDGGPIDPDATLTIVNPVDYARLIQLRGAKRLAVSAGIVDRLSNGVKAQFGTKAFLITVKFIQLPPSVGPAYRLQSASTRVMSGGRRVKRKDSPKGSAINYPALVVTQRWSFT
jgi:hypothetical protein